MTDYPRVTQVTFQQDTLVALQYQGHVFVPMRRIVENLGMAWGTQQQKLLRNQEKFGCIYMNMLAADGRQRRTLCLPLRKLNGWLFTINTARVREDLREKVTAYQEECFQVLYEHFLQSPPAARQMAAEDVRYLTIANEHFTEIFYTWRYKIEPALFALGSPLARHLHDRFNETSALLDKIERRQRAHK